MKSMMSFVAIALRYGSRDEVLVAPLSNDTLFESRTFRSKEPLPPLPNGGGNSLMPPPTATAPGIGKLLPPWDPDVAGGDVRARPCRPPVITEGGAGGTPSSMG